MSTVRKPKGPPPMSLLFHPKKKKLTTSTSSASPSPKRSPAPVNGAAKRPVRPPPADDNDGDLVIPEGPFQEFRLLSSSLNGWKYDVMKLDSRKPVDVMRWRKPVRLNRKDLRRNQESQDSTEGGELKPMLGLDGKEVFGKDGKRVMVDAEGRVAGQASSSQQKPNGGKKKFQKKTRQVFVVPEEVRRLRKEERYPWVLEDGLTEGGETWIGQLEDTTKADTHAIFMPAENDAFKFVPTHRWYKFQKKLKHDLPTDTAAVESAYAKSQKNDPQAWLRQRVGARGVSAATLATFEGRGNTEGSLVHTSGVSLGPGGRRLKTVDSGMNLFGDDDDDDDDKEALRRKREREYGGDGDIEEMVYEEDFADDEERVEADGDDEEAKELEERLKREYKAANKQREGYIDESDEEDDTRKKTKQQRRMEKIIRNREGNDAYDSDDDVNPYASEEESSEDEEMLPVPPPPPAPEQPVQPADVPDVPETSKALQNSGGGSRAASPAASGLGGHSVVAKRATSPKVSKLSTGSASRGSSPLANGSPVSSRAGSPVTSTNGAQKKRKATEDPGYPTSPTGGPPKPKKRKSTAAAPPGGVLDDKMVIEWLKKTPNPTTRDCIQYFTPYLTDESTKQRFTLLVKDVAHLKNGVLNLKSSYQDDTSAGSPSPVPV